MHRFREPTSGFTHLAAAVLSLVGMIWLLTRATDTPRLVGALIFGLSMVLLYTASTVMHLYNGRQRMIDVLNRLDHAAIYLLIAGSYTPFCVVFLSGPWRWGMLITVWALAAVGATLKLVLSFKGWWLHVSTLFYVLMGWLAVIALPQFIRNGTPGALALIVAGGVVYTLGAVIFAVQRPNFHRHFNHHDLWHLFVIGGSALHFVAVLLYAL